jgi:hypothetical protein
MTTERKEEEEQSMTTERKEEEQPMTPAEREQWLATRKEAGAQIDPETAEVHWGYGYTLDPYGVFPDLPEEYQQVQRLYFARAPGSNVWVEFADLPEATRRTLEVNMHHLPERYEDWPF